MKIFGEINFEELNDDTTEDLYRLQKEKCDRIFEELKNGLHGEVIKKLNRFVDELCALQDISNSVCFKLGTKKAVNILVDGLL